MQERAGIDRHDKRQTYCRMLGHDLLFGYCRSVKQGMPCFKLLDCWFEQFSVWDFVREHYSEGEIRSFLTPPKPKLTSLLELVEQAKKRVP